MDTHKTYTKAVTAGHRIPPPLTFLARHLLYYPINTVRTPGKKSHPLPRTGVLLVKSNDPFFTYAQTILRLADGASRIMLL